MLVAFSVSPVGGDDSVGDLVAEAVRVVRASGLPNRTDAMFTTIEGEWDEVMAVVKQAVDVVAAGAPRVSLVLKADIRPGVTGRPHRQGAAHRGPAGRAVTAPARRVKRLVMWDIDRTLLIGGGVALRAYATAFTAVTGVPWQAMAVTAGRTDRDISAEIFAAHGIEDCEPHLAGFFAAYADEVHANRHSFTEQGTLLPGVRQVLDRAGATARTWCRPWSPATSRPWPRRRWPRST